MSNPRYGIVYVALNSITGKCYVGQTVQPLTRRWYDHIVTSKLGVKWPLANAIRKYGSHAFQVFEVVEAQSKQELDELEKFFIALLDTSNWAFGYNATKGGTGGKQSAESIEKLRKIARTYRHKLGWKTPAEVRLKQSQAAKLDVATNPNRGMRGKRHKESSNLKRSESMKAFYARRKQIGKS